MELRVLHYFLAIAREQSIVRAAQSLQLSQPTLSTQIKNLEEELGKQLLIRGTKGSRKVTLTEEGMILRKRAENACPGCLGCSHAQSFCSGTERIHFSEGFMGQAFNPFTAGGQRRNRHTVDKTKRLRFKHCRHL